jgi:hypothetical protein
LGREQVGFAVTDDKGYVYICYVPVNEHGKTPEIVVVLSLVCRWRLGATTIAWNKVTMPSGAVLYGEIRCDSTSHRTIVVNEKQMKPREFHEYLADMYGVRGIRSDIFV